LYLLWLQKKIGFELIAWMGLRSTFFSIAHCAANGGRGVEPLLVYAQRYVSQRYGGTTMARNKQHKVKETLAAAVDLAAGPGTARTIKGKAKELAGAGAARLARAAAAAAVRLEAEGQADAVAGRLEAQAASALKQARAKLKSMGRTQADTAQHGAKK
jgi:hypothetical protein